MSSRHSLCDTLRRGRFAHPFIKLAVICLAMLSAANRSSAQLCGQLSGVNFTENFNTLASSGSSTSVPSEFSFVESGGNLTYTADSGSLTAANTYSYGTTGDRAFGEITSATLQSTIGACFVNNTNHAFSSFVIGYTGEEWRLAVNGGTNDRLDFQYSTNATSLTSGTYIDVDSLDFSTPSTTTAGSKDGNLAANRKVFAPFAITPASLIQPEATFYIRWKPVIIAGTNTNDGLAIDDFSIGTTFAPGLATDYNNNGVVDARDYVIWRKFLNQSVTIPNDITPGTVVPQDYVEWQNRFGKTSAEIGSGAALPEPASHVLFILAAGGALASRVRR
jgi:hypothetical protein